MMKHINEYNVFDKMDLDWHPTETEAQELAHVIESKFLADGEKVVINPRMNQIFVLRIKYMQSNDGNNGNMLINLSMQTNKLMLFIKTNYTIGEKNDYTVNEWHVEREKSDESWEDLLYKVERAIEKGLEHMETIQEIEKKLKNTWNESTYDYPLKKGIKYENGKVIYKVT